MDAIKSELDKNGGLYAFTPLNDDVLLPSNNQKLDCLIPLVAPVHATLGSFALTVAAVNR